MIFRSRTKKKIPAYNSEQIELMSRAGSVVASALEACAQAALPGVTTLELDQLAESVIRDYGAIPSFKGYYDYPASLCTSVNDAVVHEIPRESTVLTEGDLLSIDCGAILSGWHGDAAITVEIGEVTPEAHTLSSVTQQVLSAGIAAMQIGNRLTDISWAMESALLDFKKNIPLAHNFAIVADFGGHGIGQQMHQDPFLPNEGSPHRGPFIQEGSTLAIEPMLAIGVRETYTEADNWTVRMINQGLASHWEHTVVATSVGPKILTLK